MNEAVAERVMQEKRAYFQAMTPGERTETLAELVQWRDEALAAERPQRCPSCAETSEVVCLLDDDIRVCCAVMTELGESDA